MTKFLSCLLILISFHAKSQTVASTCTASDSIVKKYKKDADRLAVRRVYHINSTYKDSVTIDHTISNAYMAALLAVYNATALPARDTVVSLLNLHTRPDPEMNSFSIKAGPTLPWMQNLQNSVIPTGNTAIDNLITKYHLQELTYYQSTQYDVVVFKTDSNCNIAALNSKFAAVTGVMSADPSSVYNDVKEITDSINPAFKLLVYSYGFGTCADGCDYRTYWTFKVYNDCSVEYLGRKGDTPAFVGIKNNDVAFEQVKLYPNPAKDQLWIEQNTQSAAAELQVINMLGEQVLKLALTDLKQEADISTLAPGVYFVKLSSGNSYRTFKMVKE